MVVLDASRRNQPVPQLATWSLGAGIVAAVGANLAHGVRHGPVGALVSAWPALALVGSFELLMMLIRVGRGSRTGEAETASGYQPAPPLAQEAPLELPAAPTLEQPSAHGTRRARVRAPSPGSSTSTAARSNAYSTKRPDSADRPEAQSRYVTAHRITSAPYPPYLHAAVGLHSWRQHRTDRRYGRERPVGKDKLATRVRMLIVIMRRVADPSSRHLPVRPKHL